MTVQVHPDQRHTSAHPCQICGGHKDLPQGKGQRCWGYTTDGAWVHCTRSEYAGGLIEGPDGAFAHRPEGSCRCGSTHVVPRPTAAHRRPSKPIGRARVMTRLEIDGDVIEHHRRDYVDTQGIPSKRMWWTTNGEPGLRGRTPSDLPLHGWERIPEEASEVCIVEGQTAADALNEVGVPTLGTYGTSATPTHEVLTSLLRFETVRLWPDADAKGREHMQALAKQGNHPDPRIVDWHDAPATGDAADYLKAHSVKDLTDLLAQAEAIEVLGETTSISSDQSPSPLPLTDAGNAELLASLWGDRLRFDHRRKRFLVFADHRWREDSDGEPTRMALATAREWLRIAADVEDKGVKDAIVKHAKQSESNRAIDAMLKLVRALPPVADGGDDWDEDSYLLCFTNGVVELRSGKLRDGRPEDRISLSTGAAYDPDADCPRFLQFLDEVFEGDQEVIDYVQRDWGYSATGLTVEQKLNVLYGEGSNGKSALLETMRAAFGEYAVNLPFTTFEHRRYASDLTPDLALLPGKRVVTSAETNDGNRLAEARVKALTGGDAVYANPKHNKPFQFTMHAKINLAVNYLPQVNDLTESMWRRLHVLPFRRTFTGAEIDRHLLTKLRAELPGILAWVVRGAVDYLRRGLQAPPEVRRIANEWRADSDPLDDFLAERLVTDGHLAVRASELFKEYRDWADENALSTEDRLSSTKFGRLAKRRFERREDKTGRYYVGVGLRSKVEGHRSLHVPEPAAASGESPVP